MNVAALYAVDQWRDSDALVTRYTTLVKRIAHHLKARLPEHVQVDDLIQAGMIGLLEAARKFDDSQGASFETFAGIRIRGAMLDDIRKHDWAPRSVHRKAREVAEAVRQVENREGRDAHDAEIAEEMGISLDEYHQITREASGHRLLSLDELGPGDNSVAEHLPDENTTVLESIQREDLRHEIAGALSALPERERLVMVLYYDEELNLREIWQVIGVSESRVCQIHGQALMRLKTRLGEGEGSGARAW